MPISIDLPPDAPETMLRCWRCLLTPVPADDEHIGLCDDCIAFLRQETW